jgi:hypothetical protein
MSIIYFLIYALYLHSLNQKSPPPSTKRWGLIEDVIDGDAMLARRDVMGIVAGAKSS